MGCFSDREKGPPEETAKWDFITLSDFRCTSFWTIVAYGWLWFLAMVGIAVYVVDTYTAVNLLAFNHWSSKVQPKLDFKYSKWIFAVCIFLSWALCIYEWIRAWRVMRRGGVAESFLDPLAVNLQSMRRHGFKRFLVFTELTKSKKGADYVALFAYFSFKTAIRVILAEGPRQVVNSLTLYAVMQAQLLPGTTANDSGSNFDQFWFNVKTLADEDIREAAVYFGMLFSLCIWVFSAISLIASGIMYILFLWHYIPQRDGRLSIYCRRKVDKRLAKIVEHKVKLGIEKEQRRAEKAERKAELQRQKTGELTPPLQSTLKKQPTLPDLSGTLPNVDKEKGLPDFPLARHDTTATEATLPPYSSQPPNGNGRRQPRLPNLVTDVHPGMPNRSGTQGSGWSAAPSYSTDAPLLANAGYAGGDEDFHGPPSGITRQDTFASSQQFRSRAGSQSTQASRRAFTPGPGSRSQTPMSARPYTPGGYPRGPLGPPGPRFPPPMRSNSNFSFDQDPRSAMSGQPPQDFQNRGFGPPMRPDTADGMRTPFHAQQGSDSSFQGLRSQQSFSRPIRSRTGSQSTTTTAAGYNRSYMPVTSTVLEGQRSPSPESYEMQPQTARNVDTPSQSGGYLAFSPSTQNRTSIPTVQDDHLPAVTVGDTAPADNKFIAFKSSAHDRAATPAVQESSPQDVPVASPASVDNYVAFKPSVQSAASEPTVRESFCHDVVVVSPEEASASVSPDKFVAFNPSAQNRANSPKVQEGPRRDVTATSPPPADDYFGNVQHYLRPPSASTSATSPGPRYSDFVHDFLNDYEISDDGGSHRPSPLGAPGHSDHAASQEHKQEQTH